MPEDAYNGMASTLLKNPDPAASPDVRAVRGPLYAGGPSWRIELAPRAGSADRVARLDSVAGLTDGASVGPRLTHIALRATDLARSVEFYRRYAGLVVAHERVDEGTRVVWLAERAEDPPFVFVLIPMAHSDGERPGVHHFGFSVASRADVDAIAARARAEGILREGPRDAGPVVGYFCIVEDPDRNWVEFSFGQPINPRDLV